MDDMMNGCSGENLEFQKFLQTSVTCTILNFDKHWMICNFVDEITSIQANFDLSETQIVVFPQSSCKKDTIHRIQANSFHNFNSMPAFMLPQSENISATNGRWPRLFACLVSGSSCIIVFQGLNNIFIYCFLKQVQRH